MGIPHFVRRLKEAGYGDSCELGYTKSNGFHTKAIIDGPGLAYYIFNKLKANDKSTPSDGNLLFNYTSYQKCNEVILKFLENLLKYGIEVKAIFFDGMLPEAKYEVRLDRLRKCASSLAGFKILHDSAVKATRSPKVDAQRVFRSPDLMRARKELPAPPFVVPSAVESLLRSQFADRIFVVPNEADPFCAAFGRLLSIKEENAIILTNDSDLIVFDSGKRTKVTMLNDLEEIDTGDQMILKSTTFSPSEIADKLKQPGLPQLAWLMNEDTHASISKLAQQLPVNNTSEDFSNFIEQYLPAPEVSDEKIYQKLADNRTERLILANLDARVSEVVQQVENAGNALAPNRSKSEINVFLPFILEDPTSASAWELGADARLSAYTILHRSCGSATECFHEFKRNGRNVNASSISSTQLLEDDFLGVLCKTLKMSQERAAHIHADIDRWKFVVIQYMIERLYFLGKSIPGDSEIIDILIGQDIAEWRLIHLSAQYQAAYYSLRVLSQVLETVQATQLSQTQSAKLPVLNDRIRSLLNGLPPIATFFEPRVESEATLQAARTKWLPIVTEYTKAFRVEKGISRSQEKKRKSKKSKNEPGAKRLDLKEENRPSSNPFSALADG